MVGERAHGLAGGQIPQPDGGVVAAGEDLGVGGLAGDRAHRGGVASQCVDADLGTHIPDTGGGVAAAGHEDVDGRVERQRVDRGQVAVIMPDHLVVLEVPALNLTVLTTGEEVGMPVRDHQASHGGHVTGQGQFEFAGSQVPDLDDPVGGARAEPLVSRLHGHAADPAGVAGDHPAEFPGGVPVGLGHAHGLAGLHDLAGGSSGGVQARDLSADAPRLALIGSSSPAGCVWSLIQGQLIISFVLVLILNGQRGVGVDTKGTSVLLVVDLVQDGPVHGAGLNVLPQRVGFVVGGGELALVRLEHVVGALKGPEHQGRDGVAGHVFRKTHFGKKKMDNNFFFSSSFSTLALAPVPDRGACSRSLVGRS